VNDRKAELDKTDKAVVESAGLRRPQDIYTDTDNQIMRRSQERGNKRRKGMARRVAAGGLATVAVLGVNDKLSGTVPEDVPTATYVVGTDPVIDSAWDMAGSIKQKINGTPGKEKIGDIRPIVDDIMDQADDDGKPGLQIGEEIQVRADADWHENPGV